MWLRTRACLPREGRCRPKRKQFQVSSAEARRAKPPRKLGSAWVPVRLATQVASKRWSDQRQVEVSPQRVNPQPLPATKGGPKSHGRKICTTYTSRARPLARRPAGTGPLDSTALAAAKPSVTRGLNTAASQIPQLAGVNRHTNAAHLHTCLLTACLQE